MDETDRGRTVGDPLAGTAWSRPDTVNGFVRSPPNETLMRLAVADRSGARSRLLDIGCGAGRNAVPLSGAGWQVVGTDLSLAMLAAAGSRLSAEGPSNDARLVLAPMDALPFAPDSFDFIVAHGIWNLASSGAEFRRAIAEAGRVARPGCMLFVFTFSRHTLAEAAAPVDGEAFVFTQFSGRPQCFLTAEQLVAELQASGFEPDARLALRELNRRRPGQLTTGNAPVIYEGLFRYTSL